MGRHRTLRACPHDEAYDEADQYGDVDRLFKEADRWWFEPLATDLAPMTGAKTVDEERFEFTAAETTTHSSS